MKACFLIIGLLLCFTTIVAQTSLKGVVKDNAGNPIFAANVYLKNVPQESTTTDFDGNFELMVNSAEEVLVVSFIGYQSKEVPLTNHSLSDLLIVTLNSAMRTLSEVVITAKSPISKRFSAVALDKMDIYLNPTSEGDPLKILAFLPSATTTDESANPSFRGSSIDRTRVALNGVPIYQPVRNTQINKVGNFSIFNPEMIDKEYAYASNPPLTYGNTSSGLVEIATLSDLSNSQIQFSATLSSFDLFLSQKLGQKSFAQVFGNYQFSKPFIILNTPNLDNLNAFTTKDVGLNFNTKPSARVEINTFNYFIDESYDAMLNMYTYDGRSISSKVRFFTINNLKIYTNKGLFSINSMFDRAKKDFFFGNINYDKHLIQTFNSINYKHFFSNKLSLQTGVSSDYEKNTFDNVSPVYFYATSPSSPSEASSSNLNNHNLEGYMYANWDVGAHWTFFAGLRSNIPLRNQTSYLSSQLGAKYQIGEEQFILLSGGRYNSYSLPDFYSQEFTLLKSEQLALEYNYKNKNTHLKTATFYTVDRGADLGFRVINIDRQNTFGGEFSIEQYFLKYCKITVANTYLHQQLKNSTDTYRGENNFGYFIKSSLSYMNPRLFTIAITYIARPGDYYTPIVSAVLDPNTSFYNPTYSNTLNGRQLGSYNRMDINVNRYFRFNNVAITGYVSLNNVLNTKNEAGLSYNTNYSKSYPGYYQLRTFFIGAVFSLIY